MRMLRLLIVAAVLALPLTSSMAATDVAVGSFRSVALSNGGHVVIRHGAVQRVSIVEGEPRCTQIEVEGQQLVIDNIRRKNCPRYKLQIEIVTPHLASLSVSHGGTVQADGAFPAQPTLDLSVEQGGKIDARSIPANHVHASVYSGGGIFTSCRDALQASVQSGGAITYWGEPTVRRSVRDGGVVVKGD